jgi:hypothetical protein
LIENGSTYAPAKERFDGLQRLVRGDRSSTLFDGRDQFNNVPLADLVNALAGPCPASFSTKQPCDFSAGAVLGKTLGDVAFQQLLHPICHCSSLALPFLRSRIPALELIRDKFDIVQGTVLLDGPHVQPAVARKR